MAPAACAAASASPPVASAYSVEGAPLTTAATVPAASPSWRVSRVRSTLRSMTLFGQDHVERYQATDGREGHDWRNGAPVLLLTTTGRKSGQERTTPLIYQPFEDKYLIVASRGGSDQPPAWYLNLESSPEVGVQIKGDKFRAHARAASPDEKPEMWRAMAEVWPDYDKYQQGTDRAIPVVVLERKD